MASAPVNPDLVNLVYNYCRQMESELKREPNSNALFNKRLTSIIKECNPEPKVALKESFLSKLHAAFPEFSNVNRLSVLTQIVEAVEGVTVNPATSVFSRLIGKKARKVQFGEMATEIKHSDGTVNHVPTLVDQGKCPLDYARIQREITIPTLEELVELEYDELALIQALKRKLNTSLLKCGSLFDSGDIKVTNEFIETIFVHLNSPCEASVKNLIAELQSNLWTDENIKTSILKNELKSYFNPCNYHWITTSPIFNLMRKHIDEVFRDQNVITILNRSF